MGGSIIRNDKNFRVLAEKEPSFEHGVAYWNSIEPTIDGVLGGFGKGIVPRVDALGSRMFLLNLKPSLSTIVPPHHSTLPSRSRKPKALDCGAGVGRVTSDVLLPLFDRVDLLESSAHFLQKAQSASKTWRGIKDKSKGIRFFQAGLQYVDPQKLPEPFGPSVGAEDFEDGYDVIMLQWVAGHLSETDLASFLQRCSKALRTGEGEEKCFIMLKENVINSEQDVFDDTDSSFVRTDKSFKKVFDLAGLTLLREEVQQGLPAELYPVKMYALY